MNQLEQMLIMNITSNLIQKNNNDKNMRKPNKIAH